MKQLVYLWTMSLSAIVLASCSNIYDNIKEFSPEEMIYPASFDTISWKLGYERVEFYLSKKGKVPSSQMKLGKAEKTVIEYDDERIVIDSVCSWVNITGLTEQRTYHFRIYTENEHGDRSIPREARLTPFTKTDLDVLSLVPPKVIESTSAAVVEWAAPIESDLYQFFGYSAEYTDKDGRVRSFEGGTLPSFIVEEVQVGVEVPIKISAKILPYIGGQALLDTIPEWETYYNLRISESARPAIFLKSPSPAAVLNIYKEEFPLEFSWTKVEGAGGYLLKFSKTPDFSPSSTKTIEVGDVGSYLMDKEEATSQVFSDYDPITSPDEFFWRVEPKGQASSVRIQSRAINYKHVEGELVYEYVESTNPLNRYMGNFEHIWESGPYRNDDATLVWGSVALNFTGRYIAWYGLTNNDLPIAQVRVDGELVEEVNTYGERQVRKLYEKTWSSDGDHTIEISPSTFLLVHDYMVYVREVKND